MTPTAANLSSVTPYQGNDQVIVGNGTQLHISFTDHVILSTPSSKFSLNNVLIVPTFSANLLSVRKFVSENNCTIEFDSFGFYIKDFKTRKTRLSCNSHGPLYYGSSPSSGVDVFFYSFCRNSCSILSLASSSRPSKLHSFRLFSSK